MGLFLCSMALTAREGLKQATEVARKARQHPDKRADNRKV